MDFSELLDFIFIYVNILLLIELGVKCFFSGLSLWLRAADQATRPQTTAAGGMFKTHAILQVVI